MEEETATTTTTTRKQTQMEEEDDDVLMTWLSMTDDNEDDDDVFDDVMKFLDTSASDSDPTTVTTTVSGGECCKVRFIENPYTTPLNVVQSSCAYVTINGNEESCGSSFSDCGCSFMASVDMGGLRWLCGTWGSSDEARGVEYGCDGLGFGFDSDNCLERLLSEGAAAGCFSLATE